MTHTEKWNVLKAHEDTLDRIRELPSQDLAAQTAARDLDNALMLLAQGYELLERALEKASALGVE